ncbi:MAG: hypothetical protein ABSC62_06760 [Terracidiphilus sp.]
METKNGSEEHAPIYLFQVDSAKENRHFFEGMHRALPGSVYFRGRDFRVGPWTPDGLRVDLEMAVSQPCCSLTLIELEPAEPMALRSSRKYLHESSISICGTFIQYLDRVIEDCDSRADPRESRIATLRDLLAQGVPVTVKTAAALRNASAFLEEKPLIDQASLTESAESRRQRVLGERSAERRHLTFQNSLKLDTEQNKALRRCIMILDAVIRHRDHSSATVHSWIGKAPLKRLLKGMSERPVTLERFILKAENSGTTIDFEALLSELIGIWAKNGSRIEIEDGRRLIRGYFPIARDVMSDHKMDLVFEAANLEVGKLLED